MTPVCGRTRPQASRWPIAVWKSWAMGAQGRQPMQAGAWVLNYNGELYNTSELCSALAAAGVAPRGTSDTEALALSLETWGLDETLRRIEGMFAFAAWDRRSRALHLVRDRFGEKPLFYGWVGRRFVFASELKAVHTIEGFRPGIDPAAVAAFLQFSCVPAPQCIYEGFAKLRPGALGDTHRAPALPGRCPSNTSTGPPKRRSRTPDVWRRWWTTDRPKRQSTPRSPGPWRPAWSPTCRWVPCFRAASIRA